MKFPRTLAGLFLGVGLSAMLLGCGDNSVSTEIPAGKGAVAFSVTDGPLDMTTVTNLFVTFERFYVFPRPDTLPPDSTEDLTPVEVITSPTTIDLVSLSNGLTSVLGSANLPEGNYRAVFIKLSEMAWLVDADGDTQDVMVPSGVIRILTDFSVTDGELSDLVLDFDAAASLHHLPNGKYILNPVIRQVPDRPLAASIEGTVWVQTDSGLVAAGDVLVPNPRYGHHGRDMGNGPRPNPGNGRDRGRPVDTQRARVPLTVAWPMVVHASTSATDSTLDGDGGDPAGQFGGIGLLDGRENLPPGDPAFHLPWPRGTVVGLDGHYKLWRLRKDATYYLRLSLHPRSGYQIVSGPGPILLNADVTGQDFVIAPVPATP